jgi:hypothetical protein
MKRYVNWKHYGVIETIDEFDTEDEALRMLEVYKDVFHLGHLFTSGKVHNYWRKNHRKRFFVL